MGYRDDFYIRQNIIGYTGDLNGTGRNAPTVYFRKNDFWFCGCFGGWTFGHITQWHEHANNIGRNKVRTFADYSIGNTSRDGTSQEWYNGGVKHTSRNAYTRVGTGDIQTLAEAINRFKNIKTKY